MLISVICTGCPVHLGNALCLPLKELKKLYHICKFPAYRGCSIEIKGVFVRDHELDLHNVHESPKIEHLPFSDMRKGEGQMKVKNLRKRKQNVQMNLLNLEQRDWQPNLSIKDKKLQMN